ncbi:ArsR family transcriptional regulator [Sphingomonas sp. RT2P30]|uniref:ArsR family transcriptional regulator n=1 Tax=Parasphingomonas halimpatiens TaxID=3096162 RepID=UPI002FCA5C70
MNLIASLAEAPRRPRNRIATRIIMEMQVGGAATITRAFGGNFDRAVIFFALLREASALRDHAKGMATAHGTSRPGASVNALAASLDRPFETVRRHIMALIAAGLCRRDGALVRVAPEAIADKTIAAALNQLHDIMIRLIEDMVDFALPLPAQRCGVPHDRHATIAAAIDLLLIAIEFHAGQHDDWLEVLLYGSVMVANARPITYDGERAHRYSESDTVPPESLRLPVGTAAVARALGLPYSTAGRHIARMLADGRLQRRRGGLIVSTAWMSTPSQLSGARVVAERTAQILARLAASGFALDRPVSLYLNGRPALLDFGPRFASPARLSMPGHAARASAQGLPCG